MEEKDDHQCEIKCRDCVWPGLFHVTCYKRDPLSPLPYDDIKHGAYFSNGCGIVRKPLGNICGKHVKQIQILNRSPYLPPHRHTRFGLPTNRNNTRFKQLTVQTNRKKESNVKQVLGVPVNISYHILSFNWLLD